MKTILFMITILLSINSYAKESKIMLNLNTRSELKDEELLTVKTLIKQFLIAKEFKLVEQNLKNNELNNKKCETDICLLKMALSLSAKKLLIVNIDKKNDNYELEFGLLDLKVSKKYAVSAFYDGEIKNNNEFVKFLYANLNELFAQINNGLRSNATKVTQRRPESLSPPEAVTDTHPDSASRPSQKGNTKNMTNKKSHRKGIRERKKTGFNASLGGSPVIGFTIDHFFTKNIDFELSLVAGYMPIVLGLKYYFTPDDNFSAYVGIHATYLVAYAPVGLEYMFDNGFNFSIEAGVAVVPEDILCFGMCDKSGFIPVPWGGIKIGHRF